MENAIQNQNDHSNLLVDLGFTKTQAKLYLALINSGKIDAKNLAKKTNVPRQETYRALNELQEKGVIETIISSPQEYKALPLATSLKIMVNRKTEEHAQVLEKAKLCLTKFQQQSVGDCFEKNYSIRIIETKESIINKVRHLTENTESCLFVCQTLQRWLQVNFENHRTVKKALKRGVIYHVILEITPDQIPPLKKYKQILTHPNYEVRVPNQPLKLNAAIFDEKYACVSFYPSKPLSGTPVIVTNHPSLLISLIDHFETTWKNSKNFDFKEAFKPSSK